MKNLAKITIQTPHDGDGFLVTTNDMETVHLEFSDVEKRIAKYMEKLRREVRQNS